MLTRAAQQVYLGRIKRALESANQVAKQATGDTLMVTENGNREVAAEIGRKLNKALRISLSAGDEGWISEGDVDNPDRLCRRMVWVVDPIDGTREFVEGIPEWCISVGLVLEGVAVAGGISNPSTGELFLGSLDLGVTYNGEPVATSSRSSLEGALVLASRQEHARGEWFRFEGKEFTIRPTGSVAYKLALVAAGLADATWTLSPRHEWDVAAGVALVTAAGGCAGSLQDTILRFNNKVSLLPGVFASGKGIWQQLRSLME